MVKIVGAGPGAKDLITVSGMIGSTIKIASGILFISLIPPRFF